MKVKCVFWCLQSYVLAHKELYSAQLLNISKMDKPEECIFWQCEKLVFRPINSKIQVTTKTGQFEMKGFFKHVIKKGHF